MESLKNFGITTLAVAASLVFAGTAMAQNVADMQDRRAQLLKQLEANQNHRAQLLKELEANGAKLETRGVTPSRNIAKAHSMGGSGLLYSGTVELGAGWTWADCDRSGGEDGSSCSDLDDESYPHIVGSGRASVPVAKNFSLQFDADGWGTFTGRDGPDAGEENLQTNFSGAVHATWRDPSKGALGVFGQVGSSNGGEEENATYWLGGLEGQLYLGDFTLYGQAGLFDADDEGNDDVFSDAWFVRAVARWFPNAKTRIQAQLAYAEGEENIGPGDDPGDDYDAISWGLRADHIFGKYPISVFLDYGGLRLSEDAPSGECCSSEDTYTEHRFIVGLAFHFGVNNLKTQDRRGVTLDTPDVGRWTATTLDIVD